MEREYNSDELIVLEKLRVRAIESYTKYLEAEQKVLKEEIGRIQLGHMEIVGMARKRWQVASNDFHKYLSGMWQNWVNWSLPTDDP